MPIYEFYCPNNHKIYSFYARSLTSARDKIPRCPDNATYKMERLFSSFSVTGRAKEKPDAPAGGGGMDDPRMEAAFSQMEREFGGMDMENPDPRQMARMMRKMSALTGEKIPGQMEEMLGRMEKGEDPEKLEEEYGDALEEPGEGDTPADPGEAGETALGTRLRKLRQRPARDKTLYEMSDYVE